MFNILGARSEDRMGIITIVDVCHCFVFNTDPPDAIINFIKILKPNIGRRNKKKTNLTMFIGFR